MGLDFRHSGMPRGHESKISVGTGTVTASAGKALLITAISNSDASAAPLTINGVQGFKVPAGGSLAFSFPIECNNFAGGSTNSSVLYSELPIL